MVYTSEVIKQKQYLKEKIRKIFKIATSILFFLMIVFIVYATYLKYVKKETSIGIFGFKSYIVMTGSMEPAYNIGDLIIIKHRKIEEIKENDVITYTLDNKRDTVTHRVTVVFEKDGKIMYKTKGDNNNREDTDTVSYDQIQGTVVFKISSIGKIFTKSFTLTSIIIAFALVLISYGSTSKKEEKRIAREDARKMYNIPKYEKEDGI